MREGLCEALFKGLRAGFVHRFVCEGLFARLLFKGFVCGFVCGFVRGLCEGLCKGLFKGLLQRFACEGFVGGFV